MSKRRRSRPEEPECPTPDGWRAFAERLARRRLVARFIGLFLGLLMIYFGLTVSIRFQNPAEAESRPWVARLVAANHAAQDHVLVPYQELLARALGAVLGWLGYDVERDGRTLRSGTFAVSVASGCDAAELTLLLTVAMLVFPVPWRQRAAGVVAGGVALAGLNFVRILSLWIIGLHWPRGFDLAHFGAWPLVLTCSTLAIFLVWLQLAGHPRSAEKMPPPGGAALTVS